MKALRGRAPALNCQVVVLGLLLVSLMGLSPFAQAPALPESVNRYAWFGCDSLTVNGSTKVYAVPAAGGAQGFGGHIASNGNILVNGNNTIAGNATPGPGKVVTINGSQSQVQGSKAPASAALPCQPQSVAAWATYAQSHNSNASVPTDILNSNRDFTLNGNKTCTLAAGTYYFRTVVLNGSAKLFVNGAVTVVCTGAVTINGNNRVNEGGEPGNLLFVLTSSSAVSLNGTSTMRLKVYAPLSALDVNGNVTGTGNLWAKVLTGNASVVWNRVKDTAAPSLTIQGPAEGASVASSQPSVQITYFDSAGGTGLNLATLHILMDGTEITSSLTVTGTGASGTVPAPLADGAHVLTASIANYEGNAAQAQSHFTVATTDTTPPSITVAGVSEGGLYGVAVTPVVTVTDPHLNSSSVQIALDGAPFVSGTLVTAEGSHTLAASAADTFGNSSQVTVHFALDLTGPTITFAAIAEGGLYGSAVTPAISVTDPHLDAASVQITLDGVPYSAGTPIAADGAHALAVTASDTLGHGAQGSIHFTLDLASPVLTVAGVAEGGLYGAAVTPTVTAADPNLDAASLAVTLNGQPFVSGTPIAAAGSYTLAASASDTLGHSAQIAVHFALDLGAPVITVAGVADAGLYPAAVTPVITVADDNLDPATVTRTLNGQPFVSGTPVTEEGSYTLAVSASDTLGNSAQTTVSFALDLTAPTIAFDGVSDGALYGQSPSAAFAVSDAHLDAASVHGTLDGQPFVSGSLVTAEGSHTLSVTGADTLGHTSQASITFGVDLSAPAITISGIEQGGSYGAEVTPVVAVTDANLNPASVSVTLNGVPFTSGTPVATDGPHTLSAAAADQAGHQAQASVSFTMDLTGPVLTVTGVNEGGMYGAAVTPVITAVDPHLDAGSLTITLDGQPFASGTPVSEQGNHTLAVSASDTFGHASQAEVHFAMDLSAPVITVVGVVDGGVYSASVSPVVTVTDDTLDPASVVITLDGQPFASGAPVSAEGVHTLRAAASDTLGHGAQTTLAFTLDLSPPIITVGGVIEGGTYGAAVSPAVTVADPHLDAATVVILLDGQPFVSGTPVSAQGSHTLTAGASDTLGHSGQVSVTFRMDLDAPVIAISGVADGGVYGAQVTPVISVTDDYLDAASVSITLDGQPFVSGTPVTQEGSHALGVSASDTLGHSAQTALSFTLDLTGPAITITGVNEGGLYGASVTPVIAVADPHLAAASTAVTLDGQPFFSGTPVSEQGSHTLSVAASDTLGNTSGSEIHFALDLNAPMIVIVGVADATVYSAAVTPVITVTDDSLNATTVAITLNGQPFVSGTPISAEGTYTLAVSASDTLGHGAETSVTFTLDLTGPVITIAGVSEGGMYGAAVTPTVTVTDSNLDAASVSITLDDQPFVSGTPVAVAGTHTLSASASDAAGHTAQATVHFSMDLSAPVITVTGVEDGLLYGAAATPVVAVEDDHLDAASVRITLDGQPFVSGTPVDAEGPHTLSVSAADTFGHETQVSLTFTLDLTAPVLAISGVSEGGLYGAAVTPVVTAADDHLNAGSLVITLDGQPFTSGASVSAEGAHTLSAAASDAAGHTAQATVHFTVDLTAPSVTISGVADGSWYNGSVTPTVTVDDANLDAASVQITLNGQPFASGTPVAQEGYYLLAATATDRAGHSGQASVSFALDLTPPQISVSSPADQSVTKDSPVTLTGYVMDAHPETLLVNGQSVGSPGQSSFSVPVTLSEGSNTIALAATDRAGNASSLDWRVTLKTAPPAVTISSPAPGFLTNLATATVTGTVSPDAVSAEVNGRAAGIAQGTFTAYEVPLPAEGSNALTATAKDAAGNSGSSSVTVLRDTQPPAITIQSPATGAQTNAASVPVTGTVADASAVTATLNGTPLVLSGTGGGACLSGCTYTTEMTLVEGNNAITVQATDAAGNASSSSRTVERATGAFTVTSVLPAPGSIGASSTAPITVSFSRPMKKTTVTASTFQVTADGAAVVGALTGQESLMTFLPQSAYLAGSTVQVSLTPGITDLAGNALTPFTASFSTASSVGGALGLALDSYPALTNQDAVTLGGRTAPGATVTLTGGAATAPAAVQADGAGRFSASAALTHDTFNAFALQATLGGATGPTVPAGVLHDGTGPSVVGFAQDGGAYLVDFDEALAAQSATLSAVKLVTGGVAALCDLSLEQGGTRLRITPEEPLGDAPATLSVAAPIADLAGNPMKEPFVKTFHGGTLGDSFLLGEVYDDATGLPLSGATVTLLSSTFQATSTQAASAGLGAWALPVPARELAVHLTAGGFSDAYRTATLQGGEVKAALDARLTRLSTEVKTLGSEAGTAHFAAGIEVAAPAGALPDGTSLTVTALSSQGLPLPLPAGFSPLAAYRLDLSAEPAQPLTLSVPLTTGAGASLPAAVLDPDQVAWVGLAPASGDGARATVSVGAAPSPRTIVLLRPDASPTAPGDVAEGQVLSGLTGYSLASATATLQAEPSTILPTQKAQATVVITPGATAPSGLPFQVSFDESLDLFGGDVRRYSAYTADLFAYQDGANPALQKATFPVSPFPGIDVLTLLQGRIGLSVGPYTEGTTGGGIFNPQDTEALEATGQGGTQVVVPPGASPSALPVRVFPVTQQSLLLPVPEGFTFLGGAELFLGGGSLTLPATLSIETGSLSAPVTAADRVVVARYDIVGGVATYLLTDLAYVVPGSGAASARLRSLSCGAGAPACDAASLPDTIASALTGLPWPRIKEEGRYLFLKATVPLGFVTGTVLDGATPVAGAFAGIMPSSSPSKGSGMAAPASRQARNDSRKSAIARERSNRSNPVDFRSRLEAAVASGLVREESLALLDLTGINAVAGPEGSYLIPSPYGPQSLKAVNLLTGDEGLASATVSEGQAPPPVINQDIPLSVTPLAVVTTFPQNGAQSVSIHSEVVVTFNRLVSPASLTPETFAVAASGAFSGGSSVPVAGSLRVLSGGTAAAFTPAQALPQGATVTVAVQGIADRNGRLLEPPLQFSFTTSVPPVTPLDPGKMEARLPDADGRITVAGGPGSVEGGAVLYLLNADHPEYGTASGTANGDGSFTLSIRGQVGDRIELHVIGAAGERTYTFEQLVSADHRSASVGPAGGTFTAPLGTQNVTLDVPEGAFSEQVVLSMQPVTDTSLLAPLPEGFISHPAFSLTMHDKDGRGVYAAKEIGLLLTTPQGLDPNKQYWLIKNVIWGPDQKHSPQIVNTMRKTACPGEPGECLVTNTWPMEGPRNDAIYALWEAQLDWGFFMMGVTAGGGNPVAIYAYPPSPFVFIKNTACLTPPVLAVLGGSYTFTLSAMDMYTNQVLLQEQVSATITPATAADIGVFTDNHTPPFPVQTTPISVRVIQIKQLDEELAGGLHYTVTYNMNTNNATVEIKGNAGAANQSRAFSLINVSDPRISPVTGDIGTSGDFDLIIALRGALTQDILLLTIESMLVEPDAPLRVVFSRTLDVPQGGAVPILVEKSQQGGAFAPVVGAGRFADNNRTIEFVPASAWEKGSRYRLTFPSLTAAQIPMPSGFEAYFQVRGEDLIGNTQDFDLVRGMVQQGSLLFAATGIPHAGTPGWTEWGIAVLDVSDPASPTMVRFYRTLNLVRGLALTRIPKPTPTAGDCTSNDPTQSIQALVAVGGGASAGGFIQLYEVRREAIMNPADATHPAPWFDHWEDLHLLGSDGLSCALLMDCLDMEGDSASGAPYQVEAIGQYAFTTVMGYALTTTDLTRICNLTGQPPTFKGSPRGENGFALGMRSLAKIANPQEQTLFLSVAGDDLRILAASNPNLAEVSRATYPYPAVFSNGRLGLAVAEKWPTRVRSIQGVDRPGTAKDLVFVADGQNGVAVFDVTFRTAPQFVACIPLRVPVPATLSGPVYLTGDDMAVDLSLDPVHRLLYVVGNTGLWLYDLSRLTWQDVATGPALLVGPGLVGRNPAFMGPDAPVIDANTGIAYTASGDTHSNYIAAMQVSAPRLAFLRPNPTPAAGASPWEEMDGVPALDSIDAQQSPRIAAWVPGGGPSDTQIAVDLHSLARGGIVRKASKSKNPPTELLGQGTRNDHKDKAVLLTRQSDDLSDANYNLYISDPIIATYNQNANVASATAPLVLAADHASLNISLDSSTNAHLGWLPTAQRAAGSHIMPYIGIDFVDTDGSSLAMINPMSLAQYQKAQNPGTPSHHITTTNSMGAILTLSQPLSDTAADSLTATLFSHSDPNAPRQTYSLTETGPNTLIFETGNHDMTLNVQASYDQNGVLQIPAMDVDYPDMLAISFAGSYNHASISAEASVLETGLSTLVFQDEIVETALTLANRDLPLSQPNTISARLRNLSGASMTVPLIETGPGTRVYQDANSGVTMNLPYIFDENGNAVTHPTPNSIDSMYAKLSVPAWGISNSAILVNEEWIDSVTYNNNVEQTQTVINMGMGPLPSMPLSEIHQTLIPQKKFFVEVHDPHVHDGDQIHLTYTDYTGAAQEEDLTLRSVDPLRLRPERSIVALDGPPYDPAIGAPSPVRRPTGLTGPDRAETLPVPTDILGAWGKPFKSLNAKMETFQNNVLRIAYNSYIGTESYVALGDSLTAGVHGAQYVYYNQLMAFPMQVADRLGIPMSSPLFDWPGKPGFMGSNALRPFPSLDVQAPTFQQDNRISRFSLPSNLGISGGDLETTLVDHRMCGKRTGLLNGLLDWATGGSNEDARQEILTNAYFDPQTHALVLDHHAPVDWLQHYPMPPSILTMWIGSNDALGVAIDSAVAEADYSVWQSNGACPSATYCPNLNQSADRNLTSIGSNGHAFQDYYRSLMVQIAKAYDSWNTQNPTKQVKPVILLGLVPDVTAIPLTQAVREGEGTSADPHTFTPFMNAKFQLWLNGQDLSGYIKRLKVHIAPSCLPDDRIYGRIGMLRIMKDFAKKAGLGIINDKLLAKKIHDYFGQIKEVNFGNDCDPSNQLAVLSEQHVLDTSKRIEDYNKIILKIAYQEDPNTWTADPDPNHALTPGVVEIINSWREQNRIHIVDFHSMLTDIAIESITAARGGASINDSFEPIHVTDKTVSDLAVLAGLTGKALEMAQADKEMFDKVNTVQVRPLVYRLYEETNPLGSLGQGGLFQSDYIHPTWTGHAAIANVFLDMLQKIAANLDESCIGARIKNAQMINVPALAAQDPWRNDKNRPQQVP